MSGRILKTSVSIARSRFRQELQVGSFDRMRWSSGSGRDQTERFKYLSVAMCR
jgi:hypothetical protein